MSVAMITLIAELVLVWFMSGCLGGVYLSLLLGAFFWMRATGKEFKVNLLELAVLLAPIGIYLGLIHGVDDRQGLYWGFANLMIVLPGVITLYLGTRSRPAYWLGVGVTIITAYVAWLIIPSKGFF